MTFASSQLPRYLRTALLGWVAFLSLQGSLLAAPRLRVLTYNVWGLSAPFSKELDSRMNGLCKTLQAQAPEQRWDVILLQEVWTPALAEKLTHCGYPHSVRLDAGKRETGLMMLSSHELLDPKRFIFETQPSGWDAFRKGESLVTKGVLTAVLDHPHLGRVFIANTHVAANYGAAVPFEKERRAQLEEVSKLVLTHGQGLPKVIGGDFNVSPTEAGYTPLWEELPLIFPQFESFEAPAGTSTHSPSNPYNHGQVDEGKLDHLYSRDGLMPTQGGLRFHVPGEIFSDHYGWETEFTPN